MLRWMSVLLLWISASASAQAPSAAEPVDASTDAVEPTDAVEGAANVSAVTEPAPVDGGATSAIRDEASASEASAAASGDATATELGASATESSGGASATTTPRDDSAVELTRPVAPPPPPVGFDDERAAPPREEPRPRSALHERFVIFSPGWMPIVTLGYRAQIVRYTGGSVSRSDTSHGLTSGVLAPVLATGDSSSRVRLGLGVGMGLDVAWRSTRSAATFPPGVVVGPPGSPSSSGRYVERTTYVYGQLAAMLVLPLGAARAIATLSWLPGNRFVTGERGSNWPTLERARFSVGVLRVPFQVSAFTGVARIAAAADVELGLQLGMGW